MAWQKDTVFNRVTGDENCLHLSVYTRILEPESPRPVMVWIHGGAFVLGSNGKDIYNPELLLRKDIVLVAVNYRLGAFGECFERAHVLPAVSQGSIQYSQPWNVDKFEVNGWL